MTEEIYHGFSLSWLDPPQTTGLFLVSGTGATEANVDRLAIATGKKGSFQIDGSQRDDAVNKAKVFVREILRLS